MKHILVVWHEESGKELVFPNATRLHDTQEEAIERAEAWLELFPEDIVMTQTVDIGVCRHCRVEIQEIPGWVIHKWGHRTGLTRICFTPELTQAEPVGRITG